MKNRLWIFALFLIIITNLNAQEKFIEEEFVEDEVNYVNLYQNAVGARYSSISGFGLSVARSIDMFTIKVCGMLHYNEKMQWTNMSKDSITIDNKDILYNIGLEIQRDIFTTNRTKVYAFIGGYTSAYKEKQFQVTSDPYWDPYTNTDKTETKLVAGLGAGFVFYMSKYIALDLNIGYKYDQANTEENGKPGKDIITTVGFGLGLSFNF